MKAKIVITTHFMNSILYTTFSVEVWQIFLNNVDLRTKYLLATVCRNWVFTFEELLTEINEEEAKLEMLSDKFYNFVNLTSLDLSTNMRHKTVYLPRSLTYLDLSSNSQFYIHALLYCCTNLTYLSLASNCNMYDFESETPLHLRNIYFPLVSTLILNNNFIFDNLSAFPSLTSLEISRTYRFPLLHPSVSLIHLNLCGSTFLADSLVLDHSSTLISLNLCDNYNVSSYVLSTCSRLTSLNISDNFMIGNEGIKGLINLTYLNLSNNQVITKDALIGLVNLRKLDLSDNQMITKSELDRDLPNLNDIITLRSKYIGYKFPRIRPEGFWKEWEDEEGYHCERIEGSFEEFRKNSIDLF